MIEPETILQPSLHTMHEYCGMVLDEAKSRDVDVADLRDEYDAADPEVDVWVNERTDAALERVADAGYAYIEQDDTLLIWPKGVEIPAEWLE